MSIPYAALAISLVLSLAPPGSGAPGASAVPPLDPGSIQKALAYSKSENGLSLVVMQSGRVVFEDYHNGFAREDSHLLASATKSFCGVLLAALIEDKLVSSFDEKIADTIPEWRSDPRKSGITLRQLLSLTSGLDPGPIGRVIGYAQALESRAVYEPGTVFQYGPSPYQIFGEVAKRKLKGEGPLEYLTRRVFQPMGLAPSGWRYGQDNNPALATGANLKAGEWAKFGEFIRNRGRVADKAVIRPELIEELLKPSPVNPAFGLGFWLEAASDIDAEESGRAIEAGNRAKLPAPAKPALKIVMSAGAGKQRLYIVDSLELVVVRQGKASAFSDVEFLGRLLEAAR